MREREERERDNGKKMEFLLFFLLLSHVKVK